MTLQICQHCSAVNLSDAVACQRCGHQILSQEQWEKKKRWKDIGIVIGIAAGLLMIIACLLILKTRSKPAAIKSNTLAPAASTSPISTGRFTPAQAKDHVGETATVCGVVASANFASRSRRHPTLLNLDEPYPRHIFSAVIWGDDRAMFDTPETKLKGKRICVTGKIGFYPRRTCCRSGQII